MNPETRLYQEVILSALRDTQSQSRASEDITAKRQADIWLRTMSDDFKTVCYLAGLDAHFIRDRYVAGEIDFAALLRSKGRKLEVTA